MESIELAPLPLAKAREFTQATASMTTGQRRQSVAAHASQIVALATHPSDSTQEIDDSEDAASHNDTEDFPEGGARAYLSVLGSFLGLIPAYGIPNSMGAIEAYISQNQLAGVSTATVAWVFSIYTFFSFGSSIFSGALFDHAGTRTPMVIGTACVFSGLIGTAFSTEVWHFVLSFGLLAGLGTGMLMSPLIGVVSHYFYTKRATFTSLATLGASVGGITIPLMLRGMYPTVGFKWAIITLAFFSLAFLCCSIVLCKERMRKPLPQTDRTFKSFINNYILNIFDYKAFRDRRFVCCVIGLTFTEATLMVTSIYIPSYALMRGHSANTGYLLVTVVNAAGVSGRLVPSYIADKYLGPFTTCILTLAGSVISSLVLWMPFGYSLGALYAFAALYGFFSGSALTISPVCVGQISRTEDFGKRFSTTYMLGSFFLLACFPIAGSIIGEGTLQEYNHFIIFSAMLALASLVSYVAVRVISVGWKLKKF